MRQWISRALWMLAGVGLALLVVWSVRTAIAQPPIPHAVQEGDDCLSCHQAGVAGAPRLAWDHLGRGNQDCLRCHTLTPAEAIKIPHTLDGRDNCLSCHRDGVGASPVLTGNHVDYANEQCRDCHQVSARALAEPTPVPRPTPVPVAGENPCAACHQLIFDDKDHALFTGQPRGDATAGTKLFAQLCVSCHGEDGKTPVGDDEVVINSEAYWSTHDDAAILQDIGMGSHGQMTAFAQDYGGPLSWKAILDLVAHIRSWGPLRSSAPTAGGGFSAGVLPIFQQHCVGCHSATQQLGGWDSSSYEGVMNSGNNAPVVVPGDPDGSLLVQKMRGTQTIGAQMPLVELLPPAQVQVIVDWILAGALND